MGIQSQSQQGGNSGEPSSRRYEQASSEKNGSAKIDVDVEIHGGTRSEGKAIHYV